MKNNKISHSARISRLARAKINLDLLITGRRDDGYHLLDSLVVFAEFGDEILVSPSDKLSLDVSGPMAQGLEGEADNLVLYAAKLLQERFNIIQGAHIELVKNLPVSSGVGGGSADAAAAIRALGELWQVPLHDITELLLLLGADVPVCFVSETMHMTGIGELILPVKIDFPLYLLLVNSGISISTPRIFRARSDRNEAFSVSRTLPGNIGSRDQLRDILTLSANDLACDACRMEPEIITVLEQIEKSGHSIYTAMSGSGATCFGLYATKAEAQEAQAGISDANPKWWVKAVRVR